MLLLRIAARGGASVGGAIVLLSCVHPAVQPEVDCSGATPMPESTAVVRNGSSGLLRGHTLDKLTGTPILGAELRWSHTGTATITDSTGAFALPVDTAGVYHLSVRRIGYRTRHMVVRWRPGPTGARAPAELPVELWQQCGRLSLATGSPNRALQPAGADRAARLAPSTVAGKLTLIAPSGRERPPLSAIC
jgi:hypothetical protein